MGIFDHDVKRGKIDKVMRMNPSVEFFIPCVGSRDENLHVFAILNKKGKVKLRFSTGCKDNVKERKFKRLVKKTHHPVYGNRDNRFDDINYYEEYNKAIKKARKYAEKKLLGR